MIVVENLNKHFGSKKAVDGVSFKVKKGEIVGILGPNGAGKTTTMRLITGIYQATEGLVSVDGMDPVDQRVTVAAKIGYLPENNPLYPEMTTEEYLAFISSVKGAKKDDLENIVEETGLKKVYNDKTEELSRGFKQRLGLAAALLGQPQAIILDEPTSGLDPIEQEKIRSLIKKRGKKNAVLLSTHILSEVEDVATRLIIINEGKIVYDGKKPKGKGAVEKIFKKLIK